jgi:hypothetical protein
MPKPWTQLTEAEMQAEREASLRRQAAKNIAGRPAGNPQFAALHLDMPRISLGGGGYIVNVRKGQSWGRV